MLKKKPKKIVYFMIGTVFLTYFLLKNMMPPHTSRAHFATMSECVQTIQEKTAHLQMQVLSDEPGKYTLIGRDSSARAHCKTKSTESAGTFVEGVMSRVTNNKSAVVVPKAGEKPSEEQIVNRKPVLTEATLRGSYAFAEEKPKPKPRKSKPISSSDDDAVDRFAKGLMQ